MAPIRRRKKDAADQALTCLDALRLLDISSKGTGPAGEATTSPPPPPPRLPQEVEVEPETSNLPSPPPPPPQKAEVEAEPETPKHSSPPPPSQEVEMEPETSKLPSPTPPQEVEVEAEAELETPKHSSPPPASQEVEMEPETSKHSSPPPQEADAEAESDMSKHVKAVLKAMLAMGALPDYDERYGNYLGDFFKDLIQTPRPIDPLWLPEPDAAGLGPEIAGRYPYVAGELARIADVDDTAEQREMLGCLGRGLLQQEQVDAAALAALEGEFHEATWDGKKAMLAKLEAEVEYAKARIDAEAMIEMLLGAAKASSSV